MAPTFHDGYTLAGRYRLDEIIGTGRTAEVYGAQDLSLNRRVAIKVLLSELAAHEQVRRAFRERIISSSTLSHPHLERVYDGGQEHGAIFVVCEYLRGGSFEDVLASGRRLSVDDGARLGRDVASGLAYAHEHGLVFGSLSPSSLLFDDEGRVRVTDLALAGLAAPYRERMSVDDARYLAPEQALGEPATDKSDVYALALILFEGVTGSAAFEGATPEAVLRARLNAPLPVRLELGTLDMILAQATVPDPLLRLDAGQFAARLGGVVVDANPIIVRPVGEQAPLLARVEPPAPRTSIGFNAPSPEQIVGTAPSGGGFSRVPRVSSAAGRGGPRVPSGGAARTPGFGLSPRDLPRTSNRRGAYLAAVVVLIVLVVIAAGVAWKLGVFKKSHTVPDLVGLTVSEASSKAAPGDFGVTMVNAASTTNPNYERVLSQDPAAGTSAKTGTDIDVKVATIATRLPKRIVGESCADATSLLAKYHLSATCPSASALYSATIAKGDVVRLLYDGASNPATVPEGSKVVLALSKGPSPTTTTTTTTVPASSVTTTSTSTTTTTAPAHAPSVVPNVIGDDYAETYAAFKKAVLYFSTTGPGAGTTTWSTVVAESPVAGTTVPYKSTVVLTVK